MVVYWLILILSSNATPMMHVGTFSKQADCETAAKQDLMIDRGSPQLEPARYYVCIQANESGTNPP